MFERRLTIVLLIPVLCGIVMVVRLYQLQIVHGAAYQEKANEALISPVQYLSPLRGRILDRFGRVLVFNKPAHDVTVHYGVLSMDESYLQGLADRINRRTRRGRSMTQADRMAEVRGQIKKMWTILQDASHIPLRELLNRREAICRSVDNLRRYIWRARQRQGFDEPLDHLRLLEEGLFHPILRDISQAARTRIELELSDLPFVRVEPSVRRVWSDQSESFCHILGTLGQVSPERIRDDPLKDDNLASYRAGDKAGVSGVELLAEQILRGKRGYERRDLDGNRKHFQPPVDGRDVRLTIDLDLQQHIAELLRAAVAEHPPSTGASCVVLDISTREILALVSVPTYRRSQFLNDYASLRDDAERRPLLFRAVMEEYQLGSIIKPVSLLAGFQYGLVDPKREVFCNGSFIPGASKWHCWTYWRGLPGHGYVSAEEAILHSCNIYFFDLGQRLNARRLTTFDRRFILGISPQHPNPSGTGLIEERGGIIPTLEWMKKNRHRGFRQADGRNYAIGQGELQLTPLQAANIYATLGAGHYRSPTLLADDSNPRKPIAFPELSNQAWEVARRGLYRCVNEAGGTAYKYSRLDSLEVCGKTGSAQCVARVSEQRFTFQVPDTGGTEKSFSVQHGQAVGTDATEGQTQWAVAPTIEKARELLAIPRSARCVKREILQRWPSNRPDKDTPPTHAWYAGYAPYHHPKIALAVVVEYGGSGGHTSGPVAKAVFQALLDSPHGYLSESRFQAAGPLAMKRSPEASSPATQIRDASRDVAAAASELP